MSSVAGFNQLKQQLNTLKGSTRGKISRKAVSAGGQVVLVKAREDAPTQSKLMKRSLGKKVKTYPGGNAVAVVGVRKGFKRQVSFKLGKRKVTQLRNPEKYLHLVLLGTKHSRANNFLERAVEGTSDVVVGRMSKIIKQELDKIGPT